MDWEKRELPVSTQAELLSLNRSGLYYQPVAPSPEEVALKHRIDEISTAHCYYGSRRIAAQLHPLWSLHSKVKATFRLPSL